MVDFALIAGQPDEAVVVTQGGVVWRASLTGAFARTEFGNLSGLIRSSSEEGLLSLAFSPNFVSDSRVYVYYTPLAARCAPITRCSRIARLAVVSNDMVATNETVVLDIDQEIAQSNHNGGRLLFGPDGYLYLSIGDGGVAGDPNETGQDYTDLIGSVLRIHVTGQQTYSIPPDNPFVGGGRRRQALGVWPAKSMALQLRPRERRPLAGGCRSGRMGGGGEDHERRQLRLGLLRGERVVQ